MAINLETAKAQLKIDHEEEDALLVGYITNAVSFAEEYQTKNYSVVPFDRMTKVTEQAILLLVTIWYENRDGTTEKSSRMTAKDPAMETVKKLLYFDRSIHV